MDHADEHRHEPDSLNRTAFAATWHCLTGCAIGEVLGLVVLVSGLAFTHRAWSQDL